MLAFIAEKEYLAEWIEYVRLNLNCFLNLIVLNCWHSTIKSWRKRANLLGPYCVSPGQETRSPKNQRGFPPENQEVLS